MRFLLCASLVSTSDIHPQHGTCPTCRHEFFPELRPVDSDAESSDGDYVPTEYEGESEFDTDYEDGFMDSDGIDVETMDIDILHRVSGDEVTEGGEQDPSASSSYLSEYHSFHEPEALSICGSDGAWWDGSVDGEQEWGLTDGDSMSTSEGELSFGERFSGTPLRVAHNWSFLSPDFLATCRSKCPRQTRL